MESRKTKALVKMGLPSNGINAAAEEDLLEDLGLHLSFVGLTGDLRHSPLIPLAERLSRFPAWILILQFQIPPVDPALL